MALYAAVAVANAPVAPFPALEFPNAIVARECSADAAVFAKHGASSAQETGDTYQCNRGRTMQKKTKLEGEGLPIPTMQIK